jgi:ribonucleases P/MRP protein subunit RPP40
MLSEGRPGIDHVYSLCDGVLRIEVSKPVFELMGLNGEAIPSHDRKHVNSRYGQSPSAEVHSRLILILHSYRNQSEAAFDGAW